MKFKKSDKELLMQWGYKEQDINQIEEATRKTTYEINEKKISTNEALNILGREQYLSGVARSAFHWTSCRENKKGQTVLFDSSKLFE